MCFKGFFVNFFEIVYLIYFNESAIHFEAFCIPLIPLADLQDYLQQKLSGGEKNIFAWNYLKSKN